MNSNMNLAAAKRLMEDLGKNLTQSDYIENICISISGISNDVYKDCAYFQTDGYTFIWTKEKAFIIEDKKIGKYVILTYNPYIRVSLKTVL